MECFLCCFCLADSCIICALTANSNDSLRRFWIGVWILVNISLFLSDSFNFWTVAEFLSTLIFSKLAWYIFWFTQIAMPIYITVSVTNHTFNKYAQNNFVSLFVFQCFSMLYTYSFYNGGYESIIFISPVIYGIIYTLVCPDFIKDFFSLVCVWFICLALDTFSNFISLWYIVHLFFAYIVFPIIEYPVIIGLLSAFVCGIESLINKIEKDYYTMHTRGKNKKQIIYFILKELLHLILLGGSLVGVYFSESIIVYIHGYCPIIISIFTMIGYSYPFALGLAYPKKVFNDTSPRNKLKVLNLISIATVLISIKVIFLK
ncbi:hypothetical protein SteCoe_17459 [Stentor coeruleus]|uniref:Uncharacterized protein n=1 Tax=Stentor coeruleus TaxID=5963 RepID=A0A1R2BYV1_9CILI|nr:hypothetical protein SteCoe_17459 [Stentor coeruleus]